MSGSWFGLLLYVFFMVFCIWFCATTAASKGRSALLFGILGALFTLITIFVVLYIPARESV